MYSKGEVTGKAYPYLAPRTARPQFHNLTNLAQFNAFIHILLDHIPVSFFMGLGGLLCLFISTSEPSRKYLPEPYYFPFALMAVGFIKPLLIASKVIPNTVKESSFEGTWHAHVPGAVKKPNGGYDNPEFVVALFGAQGLGPAGTLSDLRGKKLSDGMFHIWRDMQADEDSGLFGLETLRGVDRYSQNMLFFFVYFRDMKAVRKFAHELTHKTYWGEEYSKSVEEQNTLELWHEIFQVKENGYSDIRINPTPWGMARVWEKTKEKSENGGEEEWRSVLERGVRQPIGKPKQASEKE